MKKIVLLPLIAAIVLSISAVNVEDASALPAFSKQYHATYAKAKGADAAKAAKCFLCHDKAFPKDKKKRNAYGMALSKFVTKADYKELKADKPALKKKLEEALEKAGKEKDADGKTFAERIEAGKLPVDVPE